MSFIQLELYILYFQSNERMYTVYMFLVQYIFVSGSL